MDYEKIIKKAVEKRELVRNKKEQDEALEVLKYVKQIKALKTRIKKMLVVETLLSSNGFAYEKLCTDSWAHKLGYALNKGVLGIYGGGACGEYNLHVNAQGNPLMYGRGVIREPSHKDLWFLKRFVDEFDDFEKRVNDFVTNL